MRQRQLLCLVLVFSLGMPHTGVFAADSETPSATGTPVADSAPPLAPAEVSFSDSLFKSAMANRMALRGSKGPKDDSAFFCKDSRDYIASNDSEALLSRYLFFFKKGTGKDTNTNIEICAIYYRERYARILFDVTTQDGKAVMTAKQSEDRYLQQLSLLKKIDRGTYTLNGKISHSDKTEKKAIKELVAVVQEYWLTRFITFAYLERSREFALNGVGGVALTLGSVAGIAYFMAPKWADIAMKVPRLIFNLGMLTRNTLIGMSSVGAGLGASFAAASDLPDQYEVEVWPSPLTALDMPKDQVTIDTENVEKNILLKEAYGVGGSVITGYVGWHMVELAAEKAAGTRFVQLLLQQAQISGGLTKQAFVSAIEALELTNATEKAIVVMNTVRNSEMMALLVNGYKAMHGTATIGSLIITDVMIHYLTEWIREKSTEELRNAYVESQRRFDVAIKNFKLDPNNGKLSSEVFKTAQNMFESLRLLVSHLLIPAYQSVVEFSEVYRNEQTVPMTCNIAGMNVGPTNEKSVRKFLAALQKNERTNYLLAAEAIDQFESTIDNTELYFFSKFFKRKLSLLKISFFFDEKFGLETKQLSVSKNLNEFGKGYIRVLQGELAVNLQRMGNRLREGIDAAKKDLGVNASKANIQQYLTGKDDLNALLYEKCLNLEKVTSSPEQESPLRRWHFGN